MMTEQEINAMSVLALAHMGDAVYDLLVRRELCCKGDLTAGKLHRETISYVCATAQAKASNVLLEHLTPEESDLFKRGRNSHSHAAPKGTTPGEYHKATALEALFGWLYLLGRKDRIEELFNIIMEEQDKWR